MRMNFDKLTKYLDALPREGVPGCDLCVWVDHTPVYRHQAGKAKGNETYWLYSATKVLTMTVTMRLIEQGALRLSDEAGDYLPAFKHLTVQDGDTLRPARTSLTLERLMSMQGGLDYDYSAPAIQRVLKETGGNATTLQMAAAYAEKPLHFAGLKKYETKSQRGTLMKNVLKNRLGMRGPEFKTARLHLTSAFSEETTA